MTTQMGDVQATVAELNGEAASDSSKNLGPATDKYLTFALGEEIYGLEILKVQEIIGMMKVTRAPKTPDYIRGIINLRGQVIPVVDFRLKLGFESREDTERTCIIVVQITGDGEEVTMGILVDEVSEVLDIAKDDIEDTPNFGASVDPSSLWGWEKSGKN